MNAETVNRWIPFVLLAILLVGTIVFTNLSREGATMTSGKIEHIRAADFDAKVLKSGVPVLVDFYADWCGPCRALAPILEELAGEITDARIVKVNVDENPELAARYRVASIPNLIVFRDGQMVHQQAGLAEKAALRQLLQ